MESFWIWYKVEGLDVDRYQIIGKDYCKEFDKEFWFGLGKSMWRKHRITFADHVKYIHNNIVNN